MKKCKHPKISDFSYYKFGALEKTRHDFCPTCGWHYWAGRNWTREQWHSYIDAKEI